MGGHSVPEEKIKSRYYKALDLIPELVEICDIVHIYDNTNVPFRIFKKRKDVYLKNARIPRLLKSRMNRKFRSTFIFTCFLQLFF